MANRKRPIVLRCPVTAEERALIEQKIMEFRVRHFQPFKSAFFFQMASESA